MSFTQQIANQVSDRLKAGFPESAEQYLRKHKEHLPELKEFYENTQRNIKRGEGSYFPGYLRPGLKEILKSKIDLVNSVMNE